VQVTHEVEMTEAIGAEPRERTPTCFAIAVASCAC